MAAAAFLSRGPADPALPDASVRTEVSPAASGRSAGPSTRSISGRVLDDRGRGIGGALVRAHPRLGDLGASMPERFIDIIELPKWLNEPTAETTSAGDGSYLIDGLDRKHYVVQASAVLYSLNEVEIKGRIGIEAEHGDRGSWSGEALVGSEEFRIVLMKLMKRIGPGPGETDSLRRREIAGAARWR